MSSRKERSSYGKDRSIRDNPLPRGPRGNDVKLKRFIWLCFGDLIIVVQKHNFLLLHTRNTQHCIFDLQKLSFRFNSGERDLLADYQTMCLNSVQRWYKLFPQNTVSFIYINLSSLVLELDNRSRAASGKLVNFKRKGKNCFKVKVELERTDSPQTKVWIQSWKTFSFFV